MALLNPATSVLGALKAKHISRCACFNYSKSTLNYLATFNPFQAVTELSQEATMPWQDSYDLTLNS
jgi:hypothetical protein